MDAASHDSPDAVQRRYRPGRVAAQQHQIGPLPHGHGAEVVAFHEPGGLARRHPEHLQRRQSGGGELVAFVCVNGDDETIMPCGRCRQLLNEFAIPGMLLETVSGIRTIDEVLPDAFGPRDLEEAAR